MSLSLPTRPDLPAAGRPDTTAAETVEVDPAGVDAAEVDTVLLLAPRPDTDPLPSTARPVFVDATGRRLRRLRRVGALVGVACVGYLVVLAAAVGGGIVDPVTSGLPLSDAVSPLAADPATTTTTRPTTTTRATVRSTAATTRATTAGNPAAVAPATAAPAPTTAATAPTTAAPATTSAATSSTSAPATTTDAPATSETTTETAEAAAGGPGDADTAQGSENS